MNLVQQRTQFGTGDVGTGDIELILFVVVGAVADQQHVRPFHVGRFESERRIHFAAIEIGIEQDDLAVVDEFEIRVAGPAHRQRLRVARECAASRYQRARSAARIVAVTCSALIDRAGFARIAE